MFARRCAGCTVYCRHDTRVSQTTEVIERGIKRGSDGFRVPLEPTSATHFHFKADLAIGALDSTVERRKHLEFVRVPLNPAEIIIIMNTTQGWSPDT